MGNLRVISNHDRAFYSLMGPLLSRREIVREVGGPIWDEDDKSWAICIEEDRVLGFCGFKSHRVGPVYVVGPHRGKGIGTALVNYALGALQAPVSIRVLAATVPFYSKMGFVEVSRWKNFIKMVKEHDG
jgi:GNAT superfamily N-acetyltransferase